MRLHTGARGPMLAGIRRGANSRLRSVVVSSFLDQADMSDKAGQGSGKRRRSHKPRAEQQAAGAAQLPPGFSGAGQGGQQWQQQQGPGGSARRLHTSPPARAAAEAEPAAPEWESRTSSTTRNHLTSTPFEALPVDANTKRAIREVMGYEACSHIQELSIPVILQGSDVVCKAKTGTGKTLAFLIPAVERILAAQQAGGRPQQQPGDVSALILSPSRELAMQIAAEAGQLLKFHDIRAEVVYGGSNIGSEKSRLKRSRPQILVGTPGRLLDHLANEGLAASMRGLRNLIFDEADQLLDMGFRRDIDKILALLPPRETRQTVLFSATFPADTSSLCDYALRPGFKMVDAVGKDASEETNVQVRQAATVAPLDRQLAMLHGIIQRHKEENPSDYKVIVFFTTAAMTAYCSELWPAMGAPVLEMHSRKSQPQRTKTAAAFRNGAAQVMFSSDVSARGVDYPDVSLVVQVGLPSSAEQYVHRVGRTARAGKGGEGVLLLSPFEAHFLATLKGGKHRLPIEEYAISADQVEQLQAQVQRALPVVSQAALSKAYVGFLGYYNSQGSIRWSKTELVQTANEFMRHLGCQETPELEAKTVGKMGLKGTPGLRLMSKEGAAARAQQRYGSRGPAQGRSGDASPSRRYASPQQGRGYGSQAGYSNGDGGQAQYANGQQQQQPGSYRQQQGGYGQQQQQQQGRGVSRDRQPPGLGRGGNGGRQGRSAEDAAFYDGLAGPGRGAGGRQGRNNRY